MSMVPGNNFFAAGATQGGAPAPAGGSDSSQVCIPNISTAERRKRLVGGAIPFAIGLAILAALLASGADRWWRLPLILPFWAAAIGYFQWRDYT